MNDDDRDDRTAELLARALAERADQVEPDPAGLQTIQRRIGSTSRRAGSARRPWLLGAAGAGLATAAVITTVVLVSGPGRDDRAPVATDPATSPSSGPEHQTGGTVGPTGATPTQPGAVHAGVFDPGAAAQDQTTVYYLGPQPTDQKLPPRLFAETHTVTNGRSPLAAVHEFLTSTPIDRDYSSGWPEGVDVSGITEAGGVTTVALVGDSEALGTIPHRVPFCSCREAAIQALLATAGIDGQAAFTVNGDPVDLLLYTDVGPTVTTQPEMEKRAWVSIDNIVDGQTLANPVDVLVSGNTFEGNVVWELADSAGTRVAGGSVTTAMGEWRRVSVHLHSLAAGTYTFTAYEASAEDGSRINVDDKTFTVR